MNIEQISELLRVIGETIASNPILSSIAGMTGITILCNYLDLTLANTANKTYRLIRSNKLSGNIIISNSEALKATRNKPKEPVQKKEIIDIINEAFKVLKNEVSEETMKIIKRNLSNISENNSLTIKDHLLHLLGVQGRYLPESHSIKIQNSDNLRQIISHELMHAASSYSYNGKTVIGFYQRNQSIGTGINEGYTDVISKRYFCKDIETVKTGYSYLEAVSKIIELIIGKNKMEELYFQADLKGLIKELSKYQDESKVKEFIFNLDTHYKVRTSYTIIQHQDNILEKLYQKINIFLFELYQNKLKEINNPQELDTEFTNLLEAASYEGNKIKAELKPLIIQLSNQIKSKLIKITQKKNVK